MKTVMSFLMLMVLVYFSGCALFSDTDNEIKPVDEFGNEIKPKTTSEKLTEMIDSAYDYFLEKKNKEADEKVIKDQDVIDDTDTDEGTDVSSGTGPCDGQECSSYAHHTWYCWRETNSPNGTCLVTCPGKENDFDYCEMAGKRMKKHGKRQGDRDTWTSTDGLIDGVIYCFQGSKEYRFLVKGEKMWRGSCP